MLMLCFNDGRVKHTRREVPLSYVLQGELEAFQYDGLLHRNQLLCRFTSIVGGIF